ERVETPGPWVGAKRDIAAGTVDSTARLQSGDLLVLHTDGLTEAGAADGSGARFGIDRLVALIEEHGASPPATVRDAILAAVAAFSAQRDDDVTLPVARHPGPQA